MKSAEQLDREDALAPLRKSYDLPNDQCYLDGNSLGALSHAVKASIQDVVHREWGETLIGGWNNHGWLVLPMRIGDKLGALLGAAPGETLCCDNLSINLFKGLAAALELQAPRTKIVTEASHFPTDNYIAEGLAQLLGPERCEVVPVPLEDLGTIDLRDVAVVSLAHVDFRTGACRDIAGITAWAHEAGALVLWDLAHSAGVIDPALKDNDVDMAVGCTYKFLNGGPGAPGFLYVAERHHTVANPLPGWMGHADLFAFESSYRPAQGIRRFLTGTQSVISMAAVDAALTVFEEVSLDALRAKSLALSDYFLTLLHEQPATQELLCLTPREHSQRGSQISLRMPMGYPVSQALIARGVIVDFREPDIVRFGFSPLYNTFVEVRSAVTELADILRTECYREARYQHRLTVT